MQENHLKDFTYEIIEENENPYEKIIKKSGVTIEFTYRQFNLEQQQLKKDKKELQSNANICSAIIQNIENHHPYVKDFDEKQLIAISQYWTHKNRLKELEPALKETVEAIEKNEQELALIREQFSIPELEPVIEEAPKQAVPENNEQNVDSTGEQKQEA